MSDMTRWLDEQIAAAGRRKTADPVERAELAARMVALAQVRARVWRIPRPREGCNDAAGSEVAQVRSSLPPEV